jgi:AcrR family transcriptional regulator
MTPPDDEKRAYNSPLREQHAERTREVIVEAISAQIVESGLSDFSVQDIAKRAGVAVRTVYRYFPTRDDLISAAEEAWRKREPDLPSITRLEDIAPAIPVVFRYFEANREVLEAAMVTALGRQVHDRSRRRRNEKALDLARHAAPHLDERTQKTRAAILRLLGGSMVWRFLTKDMGLTLEESIEASAWAIRTLVDDTLEAERDASKAGALSTKKKKSKGAKA